jgi:ABC-type phosphate transport system auxiliary subunit
MQTTSSKHLHNDYQKWQQALGFYKDELGIYKNRLTEVAGKNTAMETMQAIEHFQNQFLIQTEQIDTLNHDIKVHLSEMAASIQERAGHVTQEQLAEQQRLQERYETQEHIFNSLKGEFTQFLAKVM